MSPKKEKKSSRRRNRDSTRQSERNDEFPSFQVDGDSFSLRHIIDNLPEEDQPAEGDENNQLINEIIDEDEQVT